MRGRVLGVLVCVLLVAGGCRRRVGDPPPAPGAGEAGATGAGPTFEIRTEIGAPIPLDLDGKLPKRIVATSDRGFVMLREDTFDVVRRLAPDGTVVWDYALTGAPAPRPGAKMGTRVHDVAVRGDSVWFAVSWLNAVKLDSIVVTADHRDGRGQVLLVELDLATGKRRSHHVLDGDPYWMGLAAHGDSLYLAMEDDHAPPGSDPLERSKFYRIVRVRQDGSVDWTVETSVIVTTPLADPPILRASSCCVVMVGTSFNEFEIADVAVSYRPDDVVAAQLWLAVISRSGKVLDARSIYETGGGFRAVVALEESRAHYAFFGAIDLVRDAKLMIASPGPGRPPHPLPLDCAPDFCGVRFLEVMPEGILAVLMNTKHLVPRLYARNGRLLAEAAPLSGTKWPLSTRQEPDGTVVAYLWDNKLDAAVPVTFRAVARDTRPRPQTARPP